MDKIELHDDKILINNNYVRLHKLELLGEKCFAVVEGSVVRYYEHLADAMNYMTMRISGHGDAQKQMLVEILSKMDLTK